MPVWLYFLFLQLFVLFLEGGVVCFALLILNNKTDV